MATVYYIYKAVYYSFNESAKRNNGTAYATDCKSLELLDKVNGEFIEAYNKMREFDKNLENQGWEQTLVRRSENYGYDSYVKVNEGDDWRDGQTAHVIYSTSELELVTK